MSDTPHLTNTAKQRVHDVVAFCNKHIKPNI